MIPEYIERRIRRPAPVDCKVVPGSTPVVVFGQTRTARVATLGLNPSKVEFLDRRGNELQGVHRRLATHSSLGISNLSDAPLSVVTQVFRECETYFLRNPYRRWFDQLERILASCNASYYDGTSCHLDLVQWATDPIWRSLERKTQDELLASDVSFLIEQLETENIQLLLLNGASVIDQFLARTDASLYEVDRITNLGRIKPKLWVGETLQNIKVVGWSTNIQSTWGLTRDLRNEIANRVRMLVGHY